MGDVSDYLLGNYQSLYKSNNLGKTLQPSGLKDRRDNVKNYRKKTRNQLMYQKRNIDDNLTPINTPDPKGKQRMTERQQSIEINNVNKRLELLAKWKQEKKTRIIAEKKKAKPIFKVTHVPTEIGLPDLNNVNKEIKGKAIKKQDSAPFKSQFAPTNYKFKAPDNIKPIEIKQIVKTSKKPVASPVKPSTSGTRRKVTAKNTESESTSPKKGRTRVASKNRKDTGQEIPRSNTHNLRSNTLGANSLEINKKVEEKPTGQQKTLRKVNLPLPAKPTNTTPNKKLDRKQNKKELVEAADENHSKEVSVKKSSRKANKKVVHEELSKPERVITEDHSEDDDEMVVLTIEKKPSNKTSKKNSRKHPETSKTVELTVASKSEESEMVKSAKKISKPKKSSKKIAIASHVEEIINDASGDIDVKKAETNLKPIRAVRKPINSTPKNVKKFPKTPRKPASDVDLTDENDSSTEGGKYVLKSSSFDLMSPDYPIANNNDTDGSLNNSVHTPKSQSQNSNSITSPVYVSPFVTISRGKNSARKEFHSRNTSIEDGVLNTSEVKLDYLKHTSPEAGAEYFTTKLNREIDRIEELYSEWIEYQANNDVPEEATDMIDVAIGQSKLLISQKFQQFRDLIEQCRNCTYKEKSVTCKDLHGFWDMIYIQVENLDKRFSNLNNLRENKWQEILPEKKKPVPAQKRRGRPPKSNNGGTSSLKDLIKAARQKKRTNNALVPPSDDQILFEGGFFSVRSPANHITEPGSSVRSARKSLRVSVLSNQINKRISSPGLTMMKVTQGLKTCDGPTPAKSILKSDVAKSCGGLTKSVLFRQDAVMDDENDSEPDKENAFNDSNLITFTSPAMTPSRRSSRLSKLKV